MSNFDETRMRSATYSARVDRDRPACLIFLLDQSNSMRDPLAGDPNRSRHVALAEILNGLLYEVVLRCVKSPQEGPRPYFAVAVVFVGGLVVFVTGVVVVVAGESDF